MGMMHILNTYSLTGSLPDTPYLNRLESRWELNPTRFESNHPVLGRLMTEAECPGILPNGGLFDKLRYRYELNHVRFSHYHPFWGMLFDRERAAMVKCSSSQPKPECPKPGTSISAPEPSSIVMLGLSIALLGLFAKMRRETFSRRSQVD